MRRVVGISLTLAAALAAGASHAAEKKVLMFTRSAGFQHDVVRRGPNGQLGKAEQIVVGRPAHADPPASRRSTHAARARRRALSRL